MPMAAAACVCVCVRVCVCVCVCGCQGLEIKGELKMTVNDAESAYTRVQARRGGGGCVGRGAVLGRSGPVPTPRCDAITWERGQSLRRGYDSDLRPVTRIGDRVTSRLGCRRLGYATTRLGCA